MGQVFHLSDDSIQALLAGGRRFFVEIITKERKVRQIFQYVFASNAHSAVEDILTYYREKRKGYILQKIIVHRTTQAFSRRHRPVGIWTRGKGFKASLS
jgi:hypothetical protein